MVPKPPVPSAPPTIVGHLPRRLAEFRRNHEKGACAIAIEEAAYGICRSLQTGESIDSEKKMLGMLASIPPERVEGNIPGHYFPLRPIIEHISNYSRFESVRKAASALLESAGTVALVSSIASKTDCRPVYPHFSKPPLRIQALEVLRGHIEGYAPDYTETDLKNAIDALRFDRDREVARVLANLACSTQYESVKMKAREVLLEF